MEAKKERLSNIESIVNSLISDGICNEESYLFSLIANEGITIDSYVVGITSNCLHCLSGALGNSKRVNELLELGYKHKPIEDLLKHILYSDLNMPFNDYYYSEFVNTHYQGYKYLWKAAQKEEPNTNIAYLKVVAYCLLVEQIIDILANYLVEASCININEQWRG